MTPEQMIREIEALPREEQAAVIQFACRLDGERELSGRELSVLAERLAATTDTAEALVLRKQIVHAFYGGEPHG